MTKVEGSGRSNRIITLRNPYAESILKQANNLKNQSEYAKAIDLYDRVLAIEPGNHRAFHSKGNALDMSGHFEEAVVCYDSALECDPFNAETWYNKGVTLLKLGRQDEGDFCIERGISFAFGY